MRPWQPAASREASDSRFPHKSTCASAGRQGDAPLETLFDARRHHVFFITVPAEVLDTAAASRPTASTPSSNRSMPTSKTVPWPICRRCLGRELCLSRCRGRGTRSCSAIIARGRHFKFEAVLCSPFAGLEIRSAVQHHWPASGFWGQCLTTTR